MRAFTITIFFIISSTIFLNSCIEKSNPIIGNWIEQDNFKNPLIYQFEEDYYRMLNGDFSGEKVYKIKNDTFMFDNFFELEKVRFEIHKNVLKFYSIEKDSLLSKFEKYTFQNFIDYFNAKKNTSIKLPELEAKIVDWDDNVNTIVCGHNENGKMVIFFNGEQHYLDSLSYIKLLPNVDEFLYRTDTDLVFCDRRIKLVDLNNLKNELKKARRNRITFVAQNDIGDLQGIKVVLPYIESEIPDSLLSKYPPPPPILNYGNFNSDNILCKVQENSKELNSKKITDEEFQAFLKNEIRTNKRLTVHVYFDENMDCENYLQELSEIRKAYYSVRKEYSLEKYNEPDFENLESDILREIKNKFPMRIWEIDKEEYEKLLINRNDVS